MKYIATLCFVLASLASFGQFTIKPITVQSEGFDTELKFPVIVWPQQTALAARMNSQLLKVGLELPAESTTKQVQDAMQPWSAFDYSILLQSDKLFVIRLNRAGTHSIPNNVTFSFDARTGEAIDMNTVFNPRLSTIKKSLLDEWKNRIKGHLNDERGSEYKECLDQANQTSELAVTAMHFINNGIEFEGSCCLDVTSFMMEGNTRDPFSRSFDQLWFALSAYGLSYFKGPSPGGSVFNVVLHGTIDQKYPLSVILFPPKQGGEITGWEVYDKFGQNIQMKGSMEGNKLTLHELDATGKPQATLQGAWDGASWQGTFTNSKTGKVLSLQLSAQR